MSAVSEHHAYHALALGLQSNFRELERTRERFPSWVAAYTAIRSEKPLPDPTSAWETLAPHGIRLLLRSDSDFPSLLREIPWAPLGIYVRGVLPPEGYPAVAIVGTRKATAGGKDTARSFGKQLAEAGCAVISGLALGIDAAAHEGALDAAGRTIAVLATGLDRVYPRYHAKLAERIVHKSGALISEYPPGSPTFPYRFLERNRIVSGYSLGTLVIEAPRASGSLVTARFALEQNRSVFVLPGPASHPNFAGSHDLIRAGAELVTESAQILQDLGLEKAALNTVRFESENPDEMLIVRALRNAGAPLDVDKIAERTSLKTHIVNQTLSFLIMRGAITESPTGYAVK